MKSYHYKKLNWPSWSPREFGILNKKYPTTTNKKLAELLKRDPRDIVAKARIHEMKKKNVKRAGRKKGSKKPPTEVLFMRIPKGSKSEVQKIVRDYLEQRSNTLDNLTPDQSSS